VAIRPESLRLARDGVAAGVGQGVLCGELADVTFLGNLVDCHVVLGDGTRVRVQADPGAPLRPGQTLRLAFDGEACTVFEG
jgi:ABC-type sugar transport system ATPase subunit